MNAYLVQSNKKQEQSHHSSLPTTLRRRCRQSTRRRRFMILSALWHERRDVTRGSNGDVKIKAVVKDETLLGWEVRELRQREHGRSGSCS